MTQTTLLHHDNPIPQNPHPVPVKGPDNCNYLCEYCDIEIFKKCFGQGGSV